jgi:hypothetical protein
MVVFVLLAAALVLIAAGLLAVPLFKARSRFKPAVGTGCCYWGPQSSTWRSARSHRERRPRPDRRPSWSSSWHNTLNLIPRISTVG